MTDDINCGEWTNVDTLKIDIFEHNFTRPDACVKADPNNPIC